MRSAAFHEPDTGMGAGDTRVTEKDGACYGQSCVPPNSHVEAITASTSECDCICITLKRGHWVGPKPI